MTSYGTCTGCGMPVDTHITNDDARTFVERGIDDGKTVKRWSETTVRRVSAYLTGCCADYGMLERGLRSNRRDAAVPHLAVCGCISA